MHVHTRFAGVCVVYACTHPLCSCVYARRMVKSRFTSVDIAAMVFGLSSELVGSKVVNVYDIAGKLFLIKFSAGNVLLIESGLRFHLTEFQRNKAQIPSGWTMNLRKLLKGKTLERIEQVGADRVVMLGFGQVVIILEMYSKGNIVVCDSDLRVLMLLRSFEFAQETQVADETSGTMVGKNLVYPLAVAARVMQPILPYDENEPINVKNLSKIVPFAHMGLLKQACAVSGSGIGACVAFCERVWESAKTCVGGYVCGGEFGPSGCYHTCDKCVQFPTFSKAVDQFFSAREQSGDSDKLESQRRALFSRVEKIKSDQTRRIEELEIEQTTLWRKANVLEDNLQVASLALQLVNVLVSKKMAWGEIRQAIKTQGELGHSIASQVGELDFSRNKMELLIGNESVWLDLGLNAPLNVAHLHALRKSQQLKLERTRQHAAHAIREAESKWKADMCKFDDSVARDRNLAKVRRRFWFVKFHWFITSEGFLVIAGRDATQNESIYKKHLERGDAYVHADIHGAASVVVKLGNLAPAITPISLAEAGQFSLCLSSAWSSKIVTSAWWVRADQVSKTAPTGEYLVTGSFMIRGRKNFLPPTRLELGIGVLFYLSEESASAHPIERKIRSELDAADESEEEHTQIHTQRVMEKHAQIHAQKSTQKGTQNTHKDTDDTQMHNTPKAISQRTLRLKKKQQKKSEFSDDDEFFRRQILGKNAPVIAPVEVPVVDSSQPPVTKVCFKCQQEGHLAAQCPSQVSPQFPNAEEEEVLEMNVLDRLAATVDETEEILHAVPVCAPYAALAYYPLKIKIVPGSTKRGKAAKLCTQILAGMTPVPLQQQLLKSIPVEEYSECLVGDVKLAAPGIAKIQIDNKKQKKSIQKTNTRA